MTEAIDKNYSVLVADADARTCSVVHGALGDHGHHVTICHDGGKAWKLIQRGDCDLVLLELQLPGVNGFDLMSRCRLSPDLENTPIIVLSESTDDDVCDRALALGASAFIMKPLRLPLLSHTVWQVLRNRARDQELLRFKTLLGVESGRKAAFA
ncbi:MAG: response regulator [Alphaproteobacteria bacterium]